MSARPGRVCWRGNGTEISVLDDGAVTTAAGERLQSHEFSWLPPVTGTVVCVALNHAPELAGLQAEFSADPYKSPPHHPVLFIKPPATLCGHLAPVQQPRQVQSIQPGAALALVIGARTRRVPAAEAWKHVAGYTLFNDFSLPTKSFFRPPVKSRCLDSFGPMGPCVVPRDELPQPEQIVVRTLVNGKARQQHSWLDLVHGVPALIEHISGFMTLEPGDVIVPSVPSARIDVVAGDVVTVEADGIGRLENRIVGEQEYYAGIEVAAA